MTTMHCIPPITDLARPARHYQGEAPVRQLYHLFQDDPLLLGLPVTLDGRFGGIISRRWLFNFMSRPFCYDLFGKTPVSELLTAERGLRVCFTADLNINEALQILLREDPHLEIDIIPIVDGEICLGVVAASELMMAVSHTQSALLGELDRVTSRLREEVEKARLVQLDLLPEPEFSCCGVTIGAAMKTSSEVGGDFYDYFTVGPDLLGLVVGDVSGHGVQAGMVTTAAKASLHTLIDRGVTTPSDLLAGMNNAIIATAKKSLLMTCLIAIIDLQRGECRIANAGHNYPYLYRCADKRLAMLDDDNGFPLGFDSASEYREVRYGVSGGDRLIIFTDGLVECVNVKGEEYGYWRLETSISRDVALSPREMSLRLLAEAASFAGHHNFEDDVSIVVASISLELENARTVL